MATLFLSILFSVGILNDTLRYDLSTKSWTQMAAAAGESSGESPASVGRYFHAAVCVPRENTVYLYGGMALKGESRNLSAVGVGQGWWCSLARIFFLVIEA